MESPAEGSDTDHVSVTLVKYSRSDKGSWRTADSDTAHQQQRPGLSGICYQDLNQNRVEREGKESLLTIQFLLAQDVLL